MPAFDFVLAGRYRLIAPLGEGGMASVYRARDLRLNREVAVKILRDELTRDPEFLERFAREAQFVASLSHPNIVPVYDVGDEQGTRFIVMEYIRGRTLREALDNGGPLTVEKAEGIMRSVLDALGYAHERGLIHRDVKPPNILLTSDGRAKLADFGIARVVEGSSTRTAMILGSAQYLSPEQARGEEATVASDIYACGVTLYEMIAGRPPFDGSNALAIAHHHVHSAPPPLLETGDGITREFAGAIARALSKEPLDRFANAAQFAEAISHSIPDLSATKVQPLSGDDTQPLAVSPRARPVSRPAAPSQDTLILRRSGRKMGVLALVAACVLGGASIVAEMSFDGYTLPSYPSVPYALIPAVIAAALAFSWFHVRSWSYQMDMNAAVLKWGLLTHNRFGVPVRFITTLELKQSMIDRLLRVGTIELAARDEHGMERRLVLEDLPHPRESYDELMRFLGRANRSRPVIGSDDRGEP